MFKIDNNMRRHAKNERVAEVARKSIETLAATHQALNMSAVHADHHKCLLFIPLKTGRRCTCSSTASLLDENGNMSDFGIKAILDSTPINKLIGMSSTDVEVFEYDGGASDSTDELYDDDFMLNGQPVHDQIDTEKSPGVGSTACNICQGLPFVGGYSVHNGLRLVLDVTAPHTGNRFDTNSASPYFYSLSANGYVEFPVLIPAGMIRVDAFRLWNNFTIMKSYRILLDGVEVTQDTILAHPNLGKPQVLRVVALDKLDFTHFELQVGGTELTPVDLSRYTNTTQNTMYRQLGDFTAVIWPTFIGDLKGAIVEETVEGLKFRISEFNRNSDHVGNQLFNECTMRVVQPYELASYLPTFNKYSHKAAQRLTHRNQHQNILL